MQTRIRHVPLARIGAKTELRLRPETEGRLPPLFDLRRMSARMLPRDRLASELPQTSEAEVVPDGDRSRRASARPCSLVLASASAPLPRRGSASTAGGDAAVLGTADARVAAVA